MKKTQIPKMAVIFLLLLFLVGCAGIPVRDEVKVNMKVPVGEDRRESIHRTSLPIQRHGPSGLAGVDSSIPSLC